MASVVVQESPPTAVLSAAFEGDMPATSRGDSNNVQGVAGRRSAPEKVSVSASSVSSSLGQSPELNPPCKGARQTVLLLSRVFSLLPQTIL